MDLVGRGTVYIRAVQILLNEHSTTTVNASGLTIGAMEGILLP